MEIILTAVRSQSPNGRQGVPFGAGDGDGVAVGPGRLCIAWDTWYWVLGAATGLLSTGGGVNVQTCCT